MRAVLVVLLVCFLQLIAGSSPGAGSSSQHDDFPGHWSERLDRLETRLQRLDEVETRVKQLERIVRNQNIAIRTQNRKVNRLETLLQRFVRRPGNPESPPYEEVPESVLSPDKQKDEMAESEHLAAEIPEQHQGRASKRLQQRDLVPGDTASRTSVTKPARFPEISGLSRSIRGAAGVSFSAQLNYNTHHLGEHEIVTFNKVISNGGGGYNAGTGTFTCPVPGVYLFIYNLGHTGIGQTWLQLVVKGQVQNKATAEGTHNDQELQGGNALIIQLALGDTVWVEAVEANHDNQLDGGHFLTSFSGVLLY